MGSGAELCAVGGWEGNGLAASVLDQAQNSIPGSNFWDELTERNDKEITSALAHLFNARSTQMISLSLRA